MQEEWIITTDFGGCMIHIPFRMASVNRRMDCSTKLVSLYTIKPRQTLTWGIIIFLGFLNFLASSHRMMKFDTAFRQVQGIMALLLQLFNKQASRHRIFIIKPGVSRGMALRTTHPSWEQ